MNDSLSPLVEDSPRAREIFDDHMRQSHCRIDRMFVVLMFAQWAFAVICALALSPFAWDGAQRHVHPHVWLAAVIGGLLTAPVAWAGILFPGRWLTRHLIAVCQVGFSSLLIHVTGGRIETHFHVFGSLAFLAAYRDWQVLIPATVLVAVDHLLRGMFWPETVFGVVTPSSWRWLEHAGWVLFEDLFLIVCCRQGLCEVADMASHRANLERSHAVAEAANQAKTMFLANTSHEIRTPLNAILGFTDLLRAADGELSTEERQSHLEAVHRSGSHLLTVINDILDLSKIEAGQMQYERLRFSPHNVIVEVLSLLRVAAAEKGIALDARWLGRVPATILSDPARVRQVLLNLVGNAVKFTERGSVQILARLNASQELLQIEVIDTGVGIPPEKLSLIFDPFMQADVSVTRRFGGTGLGLSICRRLAEALGGSISAESCEGQGSTFTLMISTGPLLGIPLFESPPSEAVEAAILPVNHSPARLNDFRVLVVDDGETNRRLIKLLLTRVGAAVELAENGLMAVERASKEVFDIVLMDMQMPVLDGYSATRELRARGVKTPIIALTAHAMAGDKERCLEAGCDSYLAKPVNRSELVAALAKLKRSSPGEEVPPPSTEHDWDAEATDSIDCNLDLSDPEVKDIVCEFAARLPQDLCDLKAAWQNRDWLLLHQRAHSLKGTAAMTGFAALSQAAATVDDLATRAKETALPMALERLEQLVDRIAESYESPLLAAAD